MKIIAVAAAAVLWGCLPAQVKQERTVSGFHSIKVSSAIKVILTISDNESLVYEAEEEVLDNLHSEVVNGELKLYTTGRNETKGKMVAYINAKQIRSLDVTGAAEINLTNLLKTDKLKLETSGAGEVKLEIQVGELDAEIDGAADVELTGKAEQVQLAITGASDYDAADLVTANTRLKASGASKAKVNVSNNLKVNATGASNVIYTGGPKNKDIITSGAASVKQG